VATCGISSSPAVLNIPGAEGFFRIFSSRPYLEGDRYQVDNTLPASVHFVSEHIDYLSVLVQEKRGYKSICCTGSTPSTKY
jgi:hypothetical protein